MMKMSNEICLKNIEFLKKKEQEFEDANQKIFEDLDVD